MLPFAFDRSNKIEQNTTSNQQILLTQILMLAIQNERLSSAVNEQSNNKDYSFSLNPSNENISNHLKVQLELKKIEIDNLTIHLNEVQQKCIVQESKIKEQENYLNLYQTTNRDETTQIKSQLQIYKSKYEEELLQRNLYLNKETQCQKMLNQSKFREQQLTQKVSAFRNEHINLLKAKEKSIQQLQKKNKQLKIQITFSKQDFMRKEQECFSLKQSLNDAPKMEQLNRWILKVRQYEEKQVQSCGKLSQMSQQICSLKEKNRKIQHQYKQILKVKQKLEQNVTATRQNQDSMSVYFDRLSTYQNVIRDLQNQVKNLQNANKHSETKFNQKINALEEQKKNAVAQSQTILQQMNKQRSLLHAMQKELDQYTSMRQSNMSKFVQNSQNNTSRVLDSRCNQISSKQLHLPKYPSLQSTNKINREENRVNSQKIIYHSDRISHSTSRLQTNASNDSFSKQSGCRDCETRVKVARSSSSGRVPYQQILRQERQAREQRFALKQRENSLAINDSKQLLIDKLNYLKPHQQKLRITEKSLTSIHNKNLRQINNSFQSNISTMLRNQPTAKLAISKAKDVAQKQNISDMVFKKYSHLINRA